MRSVGLSLLAAFSALASGSSAGGAIARAAEGDKVSTHTAEQVHQAVEDHVERTVRDSGGIYPLADDQAGKTLELEFVQVALVSAGSLRRVHDPDRRVDRGFFACTLFHAVGAPQDKVYDVDMQIEPRDGKLAVTEVRLHKEKQLVDGKWIWETRPPSAGAAARSR